MLGKWRCHRANERQVIGAGRDMRKEPTDIHPTLAVFSKAPVRTVDCPDIVKLGRLHLQAEGLAVLLVKARLRIKAINLRHAAIHIKKDDALGLCLKMRIPGSKRPLRLSPAILREQYVQRQGAESDRTVLQHLAPAELAF